MPRTLSRMSCRTGSYRGHVSRQPSSTTFKHSSDASELSFNRYPATRSGRGKERGQIITEACSYHSQSHTACFRFPFSVGNSSFIVSVTIELSEDPVGSRAVGLEAVGPGAPLEPTTVDKNSSTQTETTQQKDPGGPANQETTIHTGPSAPAEGGSSGKKGQTSESKDSNQFGCRITEESPPTSLND